MTTTTTIEVIFAGLMLLSQPEGDGKAVVAFPKDDEHELKLILLKGKAECNGVTIEADGSTGVVFPAGDDSLLELDYPGGVPYLYWVTGAIGKVPRDKTKDYLAWLPSLSPMVMGDSRLRGRCREESAPCPAARARFFVDRGRIATCHFVHEDTISKRLQLYDLPYGETRAVADAFSVTERFKGDQIGLMRGEDMCILRPKNREIKLFIGHAPPQVISPAHESHFPRLHRLQRRFYQRLDRSKPEKANVEGRMHEEDSCEEALELAEVIFGPPPLIHSPTECGGATQP